MELLQPIKKEGISQAGYSLVKRNDGFAKLLSQVVNDTAVLYSLVYEKPVEPVVKTESKPAAETSTKADNKPEVESTTKSDAKPAVQNLAKTETKPPPEAPVITQTKPRSRFPNSQEGARYLKEPVELPKQAGTLIVVSKVREMQSDSGKHITYIDNRDSVKIFIGSDQPVAKQASTEASKKPGKKSSDIQETNRIKWLPRQWWLLVQ